MAKVHEIDGKQYVEVGRKAKEGEKVIIVNDLMAPEHNGLIGVLHDHCHGPNAFVDVGDQRDYFPLVSVGEYRVLEPVEQSEEELVTATEGNPKEMLDLVGNLAARLTKLERSVRSLQTAYTVRENNVIAPLRERIERNEIDMVEIGEKFSAKQVADIIKALGVGADE